MYVAKPPDFLMVMTEMKAERLARLMALARDAEERPGYIHWNKLRHLTPPEDLTPAEWWSGIRMNRLGNQTRLPLLDAEGRPFTYQMPHRALRLLHYIDQHCSGEIKMPELVTSEQQARSHYLVSSLMEEAIRSSQLEGATTTRHVAKELLRAGREPINRSERMIVNNYRALEFVRGTPGELTPELVMTLQGILTEGTLDDPSGAGRLQTPDEERVVVLDATTGETTHTPPPAEQLPARLQAMCNFANQEDDEKGVFIHPVVRAVVLHFWLAYDHPFQDGNGRTARALFYWYMRTRGYWLVEYLSISRILRKSATKYSEAFLLTETDAGDTTYFMLHQLNVIKQAVEELHIYLQRKMREVHDVERLLHGNDAFNHRQLALLSNASRHPEQTYSYRSHAASHKVTPETARADLSTLFDRGLLTRKQAGKAHIYSPAAELSSVLAKL